MRLPFIILASLTFAASAQADTSGPLPPLHVVTLGTSLTARGGWQEPLRERLAACTGRMVTVETVARVGETSDWGLEVAPQVRASEPDVVLIEFAVNDAALHNVISFDQSLNNMRAIVTLIRSGSKPSLIAFQSMNPLWGWRAWTRPRLNQFNNAHLNLAAKLGVVAIDHRVKWSTLSGDQIEAWIPDGLHPDPALSSGFIADNTSKVLCRHLR
jgi:acyl-CoA thioesterase-1